MKTKQSNVHGWNVILTMTLLMTGVVMVLLHLDISKEPSLPENVSLRNQRVLERWVVEVHNDDISTFMEWTLDNNWDVTVYEEFSTTEDGKHAWVLERTLDGDIEDEYSN